MTAPMTPPRIPEDCALHASPKMINGQIVRKEEPKDTRTDAEKRKDLQASRVFHSLYLSPDH